MPNAFVPLAEFLRPQTAEAVTPLAEPEPSAYEVEAAPIDEAPCNPDIVAVTGEVRRFRAALADAFDAVRADLVRDIATAIVGRELQLAEVDITAVAQRALADAFAYEPLACCVHPADARALAGMEIAVVDDPSLRRGDVVLRVRHGSIDATLGARLDDVLAAYTQ